MISNDCPCSERGAGANIFKEGKRAQGVFERDIEKSLQEETFLRWLQKYNTGWKDGQNIYNKKRVFIPWNPGKRKIINGIIFKYCPICKEFIELNHDNFNFSNRNRKKYSSYCKSCRYQYNKQKAQEKKERENAKR